jgi:hypothetical protein
MDFIAAILTNPQDLILFITLLVGFVAVLLTVVTLIWQRKHDRLSVRPIPIISTFNYGTEISIPIENCGIGPLIIKSIQVGWVAENSERKFAEWAPDQFPKKQEHVPINIHVLPLNSALLPGKTVKLLFCKIDPTKIEQRIEMNAIREDLRKIFAFRVIYTDIYGSTPVISQLAVTSETWSHIDPDEEKLFCNPS